MRALPVAAAMVVGITVGAAVLGAGIGYAGAGSARPGESPCFRAFAPLRGEAQKRAEVLSAAMRKNVAREEACKLVKHFSAAEAKVVHFVDSNAKSCGIPAQFVNSMKTNHDHTLKMEAQICDAPSRPERERRDRLQTAASSDKPYDIAGRF